MEAGPQICIVGASKVGKRSVADAIAGCPAASSWTIDNKYYSAQVALARCHTDAATLDRAAEALVIVLDASQQQSFEAARAWTAAVDIEAAEVRLLVATKVDLLLQAPHSASTGPLESERPAWLASAMDWACQHQFEYIEVCTSDPTLDARLQLDGEVQGIARVTEALAAHMWSHLTPKGGQGSAAQEASSSEDEASTDPPAPASDPMPSQPAVSKPADEAQSSSLSNPSSAPAPYSPPEVVDADPTCTSVPPTDATSTTSTTTSTSAAASQAAGQGLTHPSAAAVKLLDDAKQTEEGRHSGVDDFDKLFADMKGMQNSIRGKDQGGLG